MSVPLDVGLIQFNPTVGDIAGNAKQITQQYRNLVGQGADIVVSSELSLLGYPPRDLLHRADFLQAAKDQLHDLASVTADGPPLIVGTVTESPKTTGPPLQNSAVVLRGGEQTNTYAKRLLPTYDVFDEHRYFDPGSNPVTIQIAGTDVGLTICEDAWHDVIVTGRRRHDINPIAETAAEGADLIVTLSASPFSLGKPRRRADRFIEHAQQTDCPLVFVNQVGGNDELIFDGHSMATTADGFGEILAGFNPATTIVSTAPPARQRSMDAAMSSQARSAICLGIRDYFEKTGFDEAIIGLSGGIDSTVTTALATQALGPKHVYTVSLPSHVTSQRSIEDARNVADNFGVEFDVIPVGEAVETIHSHLESHSDRPTGVAMENLQARVRGDMLMTIANERDALVLTPDNKSEGAVGYCTLYGDTVGALAPLGDAHKGLVYDLAASINRDPPAGVASSPIPNTVIERPPTAELREDQADTDSLPPYDELDPVLIDYIEANRPVSELRERHDDNVVEQAISMITRSEFKRRQTPPPLRITTKAMGRGWNYPIAAEYNFRTGEK